jgi:GT2 family glycosyltransferase
MNAHTPALSVIIVSFNTREILRRCLARLAGQAGEAELIVVDNASSDGSADMVAQCFPQCRLVRSSVNLGFAAANNRAFALARGEFLVLLNPDAFLGPDALALALARMRSTPAAGLAGGRLLDEQGLLQPSGRLFPSLLNEWLVLSGLAARLPRSRWFGRLDRGWADPAVAARVDWVPGAFSIIRRAALERAGGFDERFFLYYEEVDLCRRIGACGYQVWYWPEIVVTHIGGACARTLADQAFSGAGAQLTLWRMRSALLYYRKHHGRLPAWSLAQLEVGWSALRLLRRALAPGAAGQARRAALRGTIRLMRQAWRDTAGGTVSPPAPWSGARDV